jgi:superfamily II DNA or RNA helicase
MKLRRYQADLVNDTIAKFKEGFRRPLIFAPTGAGKTVIASDMIKGLNQSKGWPCLFIVRQEPLIDQTVDKLKAKGVDCGVIKAGYKPQLDLPVQVATIQTMNRRKLYPPAKFVVIDEAHGALANQYDSVFEQYQDAVISGFTATPFRTKRSETLQDRFDVMVGNLQTQDLIDQGFLTPLTLYGPDPSYLDLSSVSTSKGDYKTSELAIACDLPELIQDAIAEYKAKADGKRAIAFTVNREHSYNVAAAFNAAGIPSEWVDGTTSPQERKAIYSRIRSKETLLIASVGVLCEGFDEPSVEVMLGLRPTKSHGLYLQQVGRILRLSKETGKEKAILIDQACNFYRFGHPLKILPIGFDAVEEKAKKDGHPFKECPECKCQNPISYMECHACGYRFPEKPKITDLGETRELSPEEIELLKLQKIVSENPQIKPRWIYYRFLEAFPKPNRHQLSLLGKALGYKPGWAYWEHKKLTEKQE